MHLAAVLLLTRSLSRAGEAVAADAILLAASRRHPDSADLWIQRATYQAAAGGTVAALESLDTAARIGVRTSRTGEALYQMVRLSAFAGDGPRFQRAIGLWSTKFPDSLGGSRHASARALWAFFRGDWHDPTLALVLHTTSTMTYNLAWRPGRLTWDYSHATNQPIRDLLEHERAAPTRRTNSKVYVTV